MQPHVGVADSKTFALRLVGRTDADGTLNPSGLFGPYLHSIPSNKVNGLATIRIDGAAVGANTHGWRYARSRGEMQADHSGTGYLVLDNARVQGELTADEILDAVGRP